MIIIILLILLFLFIIGNVIRDNKYSSDKLSLSDDIRNKKIKTFDYIQCKIEKEINPIIKEMKENGLNDEVNSILINIHMLFRSKIADCKSKKEIDDLTKSFDVYIKYIKNNY